MPTCGESNGKTANGLSRPPDGVERHYDRLVSTIPIPDMIEMLGDDTPKPVAEAAGCLRFNSIAICMMHIRKDKLGDNFAINLADRSVIFHRLSKLNFLAPTDSDNDTTTVMAEVTYRQNDLVDRMTDEKLLDRVIGDFVRVGFADHRRDCLAAELRRFKYAYVIYDLDHRRNVDIIREYCEKKIGLWLLGRFGEFEYINMDAAIERAFQKADTIGAEMQ